LGRLRKIRIVFGGLIMTKYAFHLTIIGDGYRDTSSFRADQRQQLDDLIARLTARGRRFIVKGI
jgi:hypothetical protein